MKHRTKIRLAIIVPVILVGLAMATGYTPWQEGAIEGLKIGFHLGIMYNNAQRGINVTGYNAEVDIYNAWIQKNFGNNATLMMQKMPVPGYYNVASSPYSNEGRINDMPAGAYYTWNPPPLEEQTRTSRIIGGLH
jgi:hypothetical protein